MHKSTRLRALLAAPSLTRAAGAHDGLGAALAEEAGFDAVWASGFALSAARALPDASLLSMADCLQGASAMNRACSLPVVADCDTGFGGVLNVAHLVREFEAAGIAAVCIEDKVFPKVNSFAEHAQPLATVPEFCHRLEVAKAVQTTADFTVIARTEAYIAGLDTAEVVRRAKAYADAGADALLVHSKSAGPEQIEDFLGRWDGRLPVVAVPTTYYQWPAAAARDAGVAMMIYANQGLRATVAAVRDTLASIIAEGSSSAVEPRLASVKDVFAVQRLDEWMALER
jgi:phosphoenolpyruvate phosphomutase